MDWLDILILGIIQGISEWLPVSSKTLGTFTYLQILHGTTALVIPILLCAHLGTLLAAAIYYRRTLWELARTFRLPAFSDQGLNVFSKTPHVFYLSALAATGLVAVPLLLIQKLVLPNLEMSWLLAIMGIGLILTAILLGTQRKGTQNREASSVTWIDGLAMGAMQGLSAIPGLSRSGCSATGAIWRGFDAKTAFELSFILSIPTVALAEMAVWSYQIFMDPVAAAALAGFPLIDALGLVVVSFAVGTLSIDALIRLAQKLDFTLIVGAFGVLMLLAAVLHVS